MLLGAGSFGTSISSAAFNPSIALPGVSPSPHYHTPVGPGSAALYRSYCIANGIDTSNLIQPHHAGVPASLVPVKTVDEQCMDSFYRYFHGSHPFVLPQKWLLQIAKEGRIEALLASIRWVGSLYIDVAPHIRERMLKEAHLLAHDPQTPKDGFFVQALMVMIVGLDGSCQQEKARILLGEAETVAVGIALNTRPFATLQGHNMAVMEESWRRTWWDLFIIDGMIAGVHRMTNFLLYDVPADVGLPCEEHEYLSGVSLQPLATTKWHVVQR